jgi:hypothetical protein
MDTAYTSRQLQKILEVIGAKSTPQSVQLLLQSGILADVFNPKAKFGKRADVRKALDLSSAISGSCQIDVDHTLFLADLMEDAKVKWITDRVSTYGEKDEIDLDLFNTEATESYWTAVRVYQWDTDIRKQDVFEEMRVDGFEPAKLEDLLRFMSPDSHGDFFHKLSREIVSRSGEATWVTLGTHVRSNKIFSPAIFYGEEFSELGAWCDPSNNGRNILFLGVEKKKNKI